MAFAMSLHMFSDGWIVDLNFYCRSCKFTAAPWRNSFRPVVVGDMIFMNQKTFQAVSVTIFGEFVVSPVSSILMMTCLQCYLSHLSRPKLSFHCL